VVGVIIVGLLWPQDQGPEYEGRTLLQWIIIHDRATGAESVHKSAYNPSALREADAAVHHIGTNALPWLIKWIQEPPTRFAWRERVSGILEKLPGRIWDWDPVDSALEDPAWVRNSAAYWGFYILGTNASTAGPELTRLAENRQSPQVARSALAALTCIGETGIPTLLAVASDTTHPNRPDAVGSLGDVKLGTNAEVVVRLLSQCIADTNQSTSVRAAEALGRLAIQPDLSVPALAEGLRDSRREVRSYCAVSLGDFGAQARSAVPALIALLGDSNWNVRICVTNALRKIAPETLDKPVH
jgi:HEAT repeat protein